MHKRDFVPKVVVGKGNFNQANLSEISSSKVPLSEPPINHTNEVTTTAAGALLLPFCFILLLWTRLLLERSDSWKLGRNRLRGRQCLQQIPCFSCRFFKNNPYLKCAVHPCKVQSAAALNCPDYWSIDSNKFDK